MSTGEHSRKNIAVSTPLARIDATIKDNAFVQARPSHIAAALRVVADDQTGEMGSATILGQFGEVPDDFAESPPGLMSDR